MFTQKNLVLALILTIGCAQSANAGAVLRHYGSAPSYTVGPSLSQVCCDVVSGHGHGDGHSHGQVVVVAPAPAPVRVVVVKAPVPPMPELPTMPEVDNYSEPVLESASELNDDPAPEILEAAPIPEPVYVAPAPEPVRNTVVVPSNTVFVSESNASESFANNYSAGSEYDQDTDYEVVDAGWAVNDVGAGGDGVVVFGDSGYGGIHADGMELVGSSRE